MQVVVNSPGALGRAIRDARVAAGLTQRQLADRAGTKQPTVSNVERGITAGSLGTVFRLLAALQLELVLQPRASSDPARAWERGSGG